MRNRERSVRVEVKRKMARAKLKLFLAHCFVLSGGLVVQSTSTAAAQFTVRPIASCGFHKDEFYDAQFDSSLESIFLTGDSSVRKITVRTCATVQSRTFEGICRDDQQVNIVRVVKGNILATMCRQVVTLDPDTLGTRDVISALPEDEHILSRSASSDGRWVAILSRVGSTANTAVRVWNVSTHERVLEKSGRFDSIALSADDGRLATQWVSRFEGKWARSRTVDVVALPQGNLVASWDSDAMWSGMSFMPTDPNKLLVDLYPKLAVLDLESNKLGTEFVNMEEGRDEQVQMPVYDRIWDPKGRWLIGNVWQGEDVGKYGMEWKVWGYPSGEVIGESVRSRKLLALLPIVLGLKKSSLGDISPDGLRVLAVYRKKVVMLELSEAKAAHPK